MKNLTWLFLFCLVGCASDREFLRQSTQDLKLRHAQIAQSLGYDKDQPDIDFIKPIWMRGPSKSERIEEKEKIERELLRRWQSGDQGAYLPIFGRQSRHGKDSNSLSFASLNTHVAGSNPVAPTTFFRSKRGFRGIPQQLLLAFSGHYRQ
jgi:hypothetical protein